MSSSTNAMTAHLDRAGIYASALCFVHCLATPVVLSLSAVSVHFLPTEEHTHRTLAVFVTLVGALALGTGYRRHKQRSILILMAVGLALIFSGAYFGDLFPNHWCEVAITLAGSACMIAAHRRNHTFCQQCVRCADQPAH
jgi:peptidoglycan/LPS O-acetylase OafA/YrhL